MPNTQFGGGNVWKLCRLCRFYGHKGLFADHLPHFPQIRAFAKPYLTRKRKKSAGESRLTILMWVGCGVAAKTKAAAAGLVARAGLPCGRRPFVTNKAAVAGAWDAALQRPLVALEMAGLAAEIRACAAFP